MRRRGISLALIALAALAALAFPVAVLAEHAQMPVVRVHAETEVMAKPGVVWAHLTTGRNLVTWCPQWKSPKNASLLLTRVDDVLDYTDEWGHGPRRTSVRVVIWLPVATC